ncbi:MAG: hypothetical protein HUK21_06315 [Fibrobacteraceae bacterium]|nr:hypothetical protein [Fibrobacteraceae bacterium]MCF0215997.1 hypothetical protein [Fibrobacteraceae bacterium]MCF0216071.1 hypothetical protein [Fibrobacteraceae bacterium]
MKCRKIILWVACALFFTQAHAADDESEQPSFSEQVELVRDYFLNSFNSAMESTGSLESWFDVRAEGKYSCWAEIDFVPPAAPLLDVSEVPYGLRIKSKSPQYKGAVTILVLTRDDVIYYERNYDKGCSAAFKDLIHELFGNEKVVYYDQSTPCKKKAVTCINEYHKGTLGKRK